MPEKFITDVATKTVQVAKEGLERFVKKAWSIMDVASEKRMPSQYLSDQAIRSIRGKK
jgi:hypothetical protein